MFDRSSRLGLVIGATLVLTTLAGSCTSGHFPATERTRVLGEWEDLRFGMFIHFGMSTFTGYEFGEFSTQAKVYAPSALDVDQWIRVARDAGMMYAILTTKHYYGHALWDSRYTDYDVASGPVPMDVVRAFVDACRKYGVRPGFYYLLGWDKLNQWARTISDYEAFCRGQVLLNQGFVDGGAVREMPATYAHREFERPPVLDPVEILSSRESH